MVSATRDDYRVSLLGIVLLAVRRTWSQPALALLALAGIVLAVGTLTSAGFFAQAVDTALLRESLAALSAETGRAPFATRVYVQPTGQQPMSLEDAERTGQQVAATFASEVGLPLRRTGLYVESGSMLLQPLPDDTRYGDKKQLGSVNVIYIADVADHIDVQGDPFAAPAVGSELEVWMHARLAAEMGVRPGERFGLSPTLRQPPIRVLVRGLWQAHDRKDPFWFNDPDLSMRAALLVKRDGYAAAIEPMLPSRIGVASWQITLDDQQALPERAAGYAAGIDRGLFSISQFLPDAKLDVSPAATLSRFGQQRDALTAQLVAFNLPAVIVLLLFLGLSAAIVNRRRESELALLASRGAGGGRSLAITLVEALLLCVIGLPAGIALGMLIARLMGYADGFLEIAPREPLPVTIGGLDLWLVALALALALLARLIPAVLAARRSVVTRRRDDGRGAHAPLWQRGGSDLLLAAAVAYGYRQLALRGGLSTRGSPSELYRDPLLVLLPALFVLAVSLLALRLFPMIARTLASLAALLPNAAPALALRQISRHQRRVAAPLLLLMIALAMGVYTRSLAASLDQWLSDRVFYRVGADVAFTPYLESEAGEPGAEWIPPVEEFLKLPGVQAATRVGVYQVTGVQRQQGRFLAIDRLDFPKAAWYRDDLSNESLGALMNRLADQPEAVLVPQSLIEQFGLRIGDQLPLRVSLGGGYAVDGPFIIAGGYQRFPSIPNDTPVIIGNLSYLFIAAGAPFPHEIWLRTAPDTDTAVLLRSVPSIMGVDPAAPRDAHSEITAAHGDMERVGLFGTLSMGFLVALLLAALGVLLHCSAALHEQGYQTAVLRAMGMGRSNVLLLAIIEQGFTLLYGATLAAGIGALAADLFVPLVRATGGLDTPPIVPIIDSAGILPLVGGAAAILLALELLLIAGTLLQRLPTAIRVGDQG